MERLTKRMLKGTGYYMKCSETCIYDCQENVDCEEFDKLLDRLAAIEDILGDNYELARLRKLVKADRDGRFVVLPCKVGDNLFYDYDCGVEKETVEKIVVEIETDCGIYNPEDIGESVYLTIEAAESALKGEQDG